MHGDVCLQEHYFSECLLQCHQGSAVMKETSSIRGPLGVFKAGKALLDRIACRLSRFSCVHVLTTLWSVACRAPLSMGFCRQESWNGLPFPPPGNLPDPGIRPMSPASPALQADFFFTTEPPGKHKIPLEPFLTAKELAREGKG